MKFIIKTASLLIVLGLALFAKEVATITALKGSVEIQSPSVKMAATLGAKLQEEDSVVTGTKSKAQIIFNDETIVTVGKESIFSIKEYVYNEKNPKVEFNLIKGAMRTITGKIGKIAPSKFKVHTRTATIGIRGTNFTVLVGDDGSQMVFCTYGAIEVTHNKVSTIVKEGQVITITKLGTVNLKAYTPQELKQMKENQFVEKAVSKLDKKVVLNSDIVLDGTTDDVSIEVLNDANTYLQDAIQTSDNTQTYTVMKGSGTNSSAYEDLALLNLSIAKDGTFQAENSYILDTESSDTIWTYGGITGSAIQNTQTSGAASSPSDTPIFTLVGSNNPTYSDYSIDQGKNYFSESSDLDQDDYMHWGEWGVKINYTYSDGSYSGSASREVEGLWVAGEPTDPSVLAAYTMGSVLYTGIYKAYDLSSNSSTGAPSLVTGTADLTVNFGGDSASLVINKSGNLWESYTMSGVKTGHMSGVGYNDQSSKATGDFYGAKGASVGGNFTIVESGTKVAKGVYEVSTSESLH